MRNLKRFVLVAEIGAGNGEARLAASRLDIAQRDFGGDRPLDVEKSGFARCGTRVRSLGGATVASEQIRLPGGVEPDLECIDGGAPPADPPEL